MKKIGSLCLVLVMCLISSSLPMLTTNVEGAGSVSATTIVNNAKSLIDKYPYVWGGESPEEGGFDCSGLVWYVYNKMSGVNISLEEAGRVRVKLESAGTKITDIHKFLPGDIVQFDYPHVAIYIGNNTIIEAQKRGTRIKYRTINSYSQVAYAIRLNSIKQDVPVSDSEINIDLMQYPTSLKQGSNFGLRGTISSANELKRIEGFIKKGNDTVQSTTDYPNKTSVNVKGLNLNKNLIFDNLGTGDYTLIVSATDSTGKTVTVTKNFSVYAEQTKADSSLSINLTRYPVTLDAGTSFGLRGSVDSNYSIARVRGYVKDSNGSVVLSSNDTPGSTSMNIQYADLNNSLVFNRLSPGSYTMIVEATDTSGRVVTATKDFSVRSKETYADNSSSGRGVDGTVQIPSSWDDLSIRTGPSTDYTIVGSMPQGARCTVYPDRAVNGWYYVNYNGIWGYASGRQINLNSGGSASSNTRIGIINIPSSWDDLSIRTGPSTDYTIVGSMPQGARCTVYPDKANGGWYYVEYNGVQGYAAGNRINLQ